ncbi:heterokaryon incompatibility protein-domain-containing protein [Aspergillus tamarii]|uniref:Heterokaryon incompatibility protein-domain-containing protein n=1 Tax=Aspergillus tamarii TaxID=41984 RepID=A0A5N6UK68_ASPTM|nr:heterokaryon incompatibility protein-domain-containing protein [Aspergillus tamarii]
MSRPYIFEPLQGGQIRLISLKPGAFHDPLHCTVAVVPLGCGSTDYECLSYAWGSASGPIQGITVDGKHFSIADVLDSALRYLRRPDEMRILWIDAVCINQADVAERNAQVAMMQDIYRGAKMVVAWLGPASATSDRAFSFLKEMARLGRRADRRASDGHVSPDGVSEQSTNSGPSQGASHDGRSEAILQSPNELSDDATQVTRNNGNIDVYYTNSNLIYTVDVEPTESEFLLRHSCETITDREPVSVFTNPSTWTRNAIKWCRARLDVSYAIRYLISWLRYYVFYVMGMLHLPRETVDARRYEEEAREWERNEATESHIISGFPVLYYDFSMPYHEFFTNSRQQDWEALDELLARPWWFRTWIVQEVWLASSCILQCGMSTMPWETFEDAMDYQEAWDDMGFMVKPTKRWGSWSSLKRRYGLAIHLSKKRLIGSKLSSLLWNMWDREATEPKDKVFAILGLVGSQHQNTMSRADYSKTMEQVYREVAVHIITVEKSLDLLLAASGTDGPADLPTWVPDWRREGNEQRPALFVNGARMQYYYSGSTDSVVLNGHGYTASGNMEPFSKFSDDLTKLHVRGILLGSVEVTGPTTNPNWSTLEIMNAARAVLQTSQDLNLVGPVALSDQDLRFILRAGSQLIPEEYDFNEEGELLLHNVMARRLFFVSSAGHLCVGPSRTCRGDVITILAGCNFPMILRQEGDSFKVVGEAYGKQLLPDFLFVAF